MSWEESVGQVLLIEDNAADVRLMHEAFKEAGARVQVHALRDGSSALAFLHREGLQTAAPRPDLILLDLNLPGKGGKEVLEEIKGDPSLKRIPVLVITSSRAHEEIARCYDLRANACIQKPVGFTELVAVVSSIYQFWFQTATLSPPTGAEAF